MPATIVIKHRRGTASTSGYSLESGVPLKTMDDRYRPSPSYAPAALANNWDPQKSGYNCNARTLRAPRSRMKRAMTPAAVLPFHALFLGDSTLIGYNGSTYQYDFSIPRQFGKTLARFLGLEHTNGLQAATATVNAVADNITLTGAWTAAASSYPHFFTGQGVGTYTATSMDPCTSVEFYVSNQSGTGLTYSVDGGTATAISPTGAATFQKITAATGLTKGVHTLTISGATAGQYCFLGAFRFWDPLVPQVQTHNLAIGGSRANDPSAPNYNWSDSTTTASGGGLAYVANQIVSLSGIAPDLLVISAGNNDHNGNIATANIITGLTTMRGYYSTPQAMLIRPPRVSGTNATTFTDLCAATMTLADTLDSLLFDWNDYDQGQANYAADGLAGPDGNHPINGEQVAVGRALVALLNPPAATPPRAEPYGQTLAADVPVAANTDTVVLTTQRLAAGTYLVTVGVTMLSGTVLGAGDLRLVAGTATASIVGQASTSYRAMAASTSANASLTALVTVTVAGTLLVRTLATQAHTAKASSVNSTYPAASGLTITRIT